MLGPTVNAIVVVICGLAGCFILRNIPSRFEDIIKKAIGLSIVFIGIDGALECEHMLLLIMSMVGGAALGELIGIDALIKKLGFWAERRLGLGSGESGGDPGTADSGRSFSRGFINASILFCSGSMAIIGSMQSGLTGNHETLFAKSILDGTISIVFGASMGIGVVFSALSVFIYQAGIALASMAVRDFLTPEMITEMSAVGSLIVAAIGFNFLGVKEIKVANFIPAIFIPLAYLSVRALF